MDLKAVGQRIKSAREAKNLTQEELAALVNLSPTHVSCLLYTSRSNRDGQNGRKKQEKN